MSCATAQTTRWRDAGEVEEVEEMWRMRRWLMVAEISPSPLTRLSPPNSNLPTGTSGRILSAPFRMRSAPTNPSHHVS